MSDDEFDERIYDAIINGGNGLASLAEGRQVLSLRSIDRPLLCGTEHKRRSILHGYFITIKLRERLVCPLIVIGLDSRVILGLMSLWF